MDANGHAVTTLTSPMLERAVDLGLMALFIICLSFVVYYIYEGYTS